MMRDFWLLTKLQLRCRFAFDTSGIRDPEAKKRRQRSTRLYIFVVLMMGFMSFSYSTAMAQTLKMLDLLPLLIALMSLVASLFVLIQSLFSSSNVLLTFSDYDLLMSLPVRREAVAASRLAMLYVYGLVDAAVALIPAAAVYAFYASPAWWFYPAAIVLVAVLPVLPTLLGTVVGVLIFSATARLKIKKALNLVFQLLFFLAIMFFSMQQQRFIENFESIAQVLQQRVAGLWPPAMWAADGVCRSPLDLLLLIGVSIAAAAVVTLFYGRLLHPLHTRMTSAPRAERYRARELKSAGALRALWRKEFRRYFDSAAYVLNTAFGYVMLLILCALPLFLDAAPFLSQFQGMLPDDIAPVLGLFMGMIVLMSSTTSSSVSMEGKQLWIVKSLPVPAVTWLLSKLLVSLTMAVPSILICGTLVCIGLKLPAASLLWLYGLPLCYALFSGLFGLAVNLRYPKLEWKNDVEVVKQSTSTMIAVLGGMALSIIPIALSFASHSVLVPGLTAAVLLAASALIAWRLSAGAERALLRL